VIAVLHVRERHVDERFHRRERIARLLGRRSAKR
jgi:cyanophycinase-like exopeptidase